MNTSLLKERLEKLDSLFCLDSDSLSERKVHKALVLDLNDETFYEWPIPVNYAESYVSGPALGARLWAHFAEGALDDESTYEAHNPVVFVASELSNSGMSSCESLSIAFRSPVTRSLVFNNFTSSFGMRLMSLGYKALVITGRLRRPAIVDIRKSGVQYNISELFIGYSVSQVENLVLSTPLTCAMSIGPAGEQKVPYAAVITEGRTTGRYGLGCVFGFKNIKSLCITGFTSDFVRTGDSQAIESSFSALRALLSESRINAAMQRCGSSCLVRSGSKAGWAPVENYSKRTDPRLFHLGGDEVARRYGENRRTCMNCPVMCRHKTPEGFEIPGYEELFMLGSNLLCFDMDRIIERYALCLDLGLDPISTGNVLGWALEATKKGLLAILGEDFSFTDNSKVLPLLEMIAHRQGPGETLSYGTYALGQALGDDSFSYTIREAEISGFDYRGLFSQCISDCMLLGVRNSFEIIGNLCTKAPSDWAYFNENLCLGLLSFGIDPSIVYQCTVEKKRSFKYVASILPKLAIKSIKLDSLTSCLSAALSHDISTASVLDLGSRTWRLVYEINKELGFDMISGSEELLPNHFRIDPSGNHNNLAIVPYRALMDRYLFLRRRMVLQQGEI